MTDFFDTHGWLTVLGYICFPRLMFWFVNTMTGGFGFWLGVLFVPRIMVAFWATTYYWNSNPWLCLGAWFVALTFEGIELRLRDKRKKRR